MFFRKKKEVSLFRSVSFEGMTAASLQQHHDDEDDDDVDFMTEVHCLLDNFYEWLFVAIRLDFLWPSISSSSITGTARVGVQEILLISIVTA